MSSARVIRIACYAAAAMLLDTSAAAGAVPANDSPATAIEFSAYTAENGAPVERQADVDLAEATADAGVPRCLGPRSFERTVWYRLPASDTPRLVRVEALSPSQETEEAPDVAAFVQPVAASGPMTAEPQACDGSGAAGTAGTAAGPDPGAAVELRVPAGHPVLVQLGRPVGQKATKVVASVRETGLSIRAALVGDLAADAPTLAAGAAGATVPLGGATLTPEDPAQPACPASGTVWRRVRTRDAGVYRVAASGAAVSAVTVFRGPAPTADGAAACVIAGSAAAPVGATDEITTVRVRASRRAILWLRVGTDAPADDATTRLAISGPCDRAPLTTGAVRLPTVRAGLRGRTRARLVVAGGCLRAVRVTLERRAGSRFRVLASVRRSRLLPGTTTVRFPARAGVRRSGTYRVTIAARTVIGGRTVRGAGTVRLR